MIIMPSTKAKIEEMQEQIRRDFASALDTAYILPIEFSKPVRKEKGIYRVSTEVVQGSGKYYPKGVFTGGGIEVAKDINDRPILIFASEYESLGNIYRTEDDGLFFGVRAEKKDFKGLEDFTLLMHFDMDLAKGTYKVQTEEKQPEGKQKS